MQKNTVRFVISRKEELKKNFNIPGYNEVILDFKNDIIFDEGDFFEPLDFSDKTVYIKGNGHTINNLRIDKPFDMEIGLIKKAKNLVVKDLTINNVNIKGGEVCGTLVGEVTNDLVITNVNIKSTLNADAICGGVCGVAKNVRVKQLNVDSEIYGRGMLAGVCAMAESYEEQETNINCRLTPSYAMIARDTASSETIGYLSSERKEQIKTMLLGLK